MGKQAGPEIMKWEIFHIPDKLSLTNEISTVEVFASRIEPPLANTLVRKLNQVAPLEHLRHVKRVQKKSVEGETQLSVILCLSNGDETPNTIPAVLELIHAYKLHLFPTKVAKYAATSKEEWEEQCKLWPTSYHPPTYNIDGITGFSEEDSQMVFKFMKDAIDLAKSVGDQVVNAALIVDPSNRHVIASACDQTSLSPAMRNKSKMGSGSYTEQVEKAKIHFDVNEAEINENVCLNCCNGEPLPLDSAVACLYPWYWTQYQLCENLVSSSGSIYPWHPLRHAAVVAIETAAARDRDLFPNLEVPKSQFNEIDQVKSPRLTSPAKRQKINGLKDKDEMLSENSSNCLSAVVRPYLCTGCDIYLVWEPCTMCAMALVHQRIRRIFYAFPNPKTGALGSVYRLQGEKSLNHHYAVFRVLLPEEVLCRSCLV
ncbi:tRNA-specific adenosine deaminase TAD3 [Aristolochia californica]|uniref:tRNA-specific adenosine deaminase TAD3 n=1 Tax=Aristolochia californica TaxID=171875 RepID=UPI0035D6AE92